MSSGLMGHRAPDSAHSSLLAPHPAYQEPDRLEGDVQERLDTDHRLSESLQEAEANPGERGISRHRLILRFARSGKD